MPESLWRVGAPYVSCGTFAISAIELQSQQSDCNLSNQTAISAIRLQSPQSECRYHTQPPRVPPERTTVYVSCGTFFRVQSQQSNCNLSNQTAISAIRLQSPQSECRHDATSLSTPGINNCICKLWNFILECNLSNQSAISAIWLQSFWIAVRLHRLIWIAKQNCNQIAISTIRLQSPQSECRHDATSLSTPGTNNCICKLGNFF